MKLTEIITESANKNLTVDEAMEIVKSKCSDSFGLRLYRGTTDVTFNAAIVTASSYKNPRRSQTRNNIMLELCSSLPSWANYAPRTRSIFMTPSYNQANNWGDVVRVFPYDTSKLVLAPSEDFNLTGAFPFAAEVLDQATIPIGNLIGGLLEEIVYAIDEAYDNDFRVREFDGINDIKLLDSKIQELKINLNDLLNHANISPDVAKMGAKSIVDLLDKLLDPSKNGYVVGTPAEIKQVLGESSHKPREVWTGDPCVVIDYDSLNEYNKQQRTKKDA